MTFKEIISRLNGVSCPVFGVSWTPPVPDVQVARRVIRFLEDRRILYNDFAWEEPSHCVQSALEIRRVLTTELGNLKDGSELVAPLRAIRAATRKFLDASHGDFGTRRGIAHDFGFFAALGELRASIGSSVAMLAVQYGIDVEDELAKTLPVADSDGGKTIEAGHPIATARLKDPMEQPSYRGEKAGPCPNCDWPETVARQSRTTKELYFGCARPKRGPAEGCNFKGRRSH
ncbi:MAG: hypothetical protein JNK87_28420 [Bryobacterales bacterium]|nr:hypothetical protein [Bryobacterales bacterium]